MATPTRSREAAGSRDSRQPTCRLGLLLAQTSHPASSGGVSGRSCCWMRRAVDTSSSIQAVRDLFLVVRAVRARPRYPLAADERYQDDSSGVMRVSVNLRPQQQDAHQLAAGALSGHRVQRKREPGADLRGLLRERRSHGRIVRSSTIARTGMGSPRSPSAARSAAPVFQSASATSPSTRPRPSDRTGAPIVGHDRGGAQHESHAGSSWPAVRCDLRGVQDERAT